MPGTRIALLIATDHYADAAFQRLQAPRQDAGELAEVLRDPDIGDYRVDVLLNRESQHIRMRIDELFANAGRDDLIVLYFSGHGVLDANARLQLATTDTRRDLLASTAVSAQFIRECIDNSRARKVAVWLDCCYSGAFPPGMIPKAPGDVDVYAQLRAESGRGCVVMTASTHIQYAFESNHQTQPSVFTSGIVEGLRSGDADRNDDGLIDAAELYDYVYEWVKERTPSQTPTQNGQVTGHIYIAHRKRATRPESVSALPASLVRPPIAPLATPQPTQQLAAAPAVVIPVSGPAPRRPKPYRPWTFRPAFWWWNAVAVTIVLPIVPYVILIIPILYIAVIGGPFVILAFRLRRGGILARNVLLVLGGGIIVLDAAASFGGVSGLNLFFSICQMVLIVVAVYCSFPRRAYT